MRINTVLLLASLLSWRVLVSYVPNPSTAVRARRVPAMTVRSRLRDAGPPPSKRPGSAMVPMHACLDFAIMGGLRIDRLRDSARDACYRAVRRFYIFIPWELRIIAEQKACPSSRW